MKNLKLYALLCLSILILGCNSKTKEIEKMKNNLLSGVFNDRGKKGSWCTTYDDEFFDGITLDCKEILTLMKDGSFIQKNIYFYQGTKMADAEIEGTWEIEYDSDLDAYFFDQEYKSGITTQNYNFSPEWYKKFDTEIRLTYNGDAYDMVDDSDDDTLYGLQIIECTQDIFIIEDLSDMETYRYEKYVNYLNME